MRSMLLSIMFCLISSVSWAEAVSWADLVENPGDGNGAPFTEMPDTFRQLQDHMLRKDGGDREMVDILSLVLHHNEDAVLRAVELALEAGVPTKTHILNLLHRLIDPKQTDHPEIDPPDALALETAPKANVDRYDDLRQTGEKRNAS